jgi:hypothetical protein
MANLIITVIAIALVAVASLMGAYYGGSAFLNNESAANASTVLNQGQQLAGAWAAYLNDNLNTVPTGGLSGAANSLTSGGYITSVPQAPAEAGSVTSKAVDVGTAGAAGHYFMWADMGKPSTGANGGTIADSNASACMHIIQTATGVKATSIKTAAPGAIAMPATASQSNGSFGCAITNAAPPTGVTGSGAAPASGDYTLEYLIQ